MSSSNALLRQLQTVHVTRCLPLLREHYRRDELLDLSIDAGDSARARGAHEVCHTILDYQPLPNGLQLALQAYLNAISLLDDDPWRTTPQRTMSLYLKLAE